jgi:rare lipoprotein A
MRNLKKILILTFSLFLHTQQIIAQTKTTTEAKKTKLELKIAKKVEEKKSTTSKKKISKKKTEAAVEETDTPLPNPTGTGKVLTGIASFYSANFEGKQTANGEIFRHSKLTCASNKFPIGTWLKITNIKNNKTIVVKVNDRMHPRMKRLVDLTLTGAKKLDFVAAGLTQVKAEVLKKK